MLLTSFWIVAGLLSLYYIYIVGRYIEGWTALPLWTLPESFQPQTFFTVLIPARNEAENIQACLESIFQQNYPAHLLEVIVIDDHSTDATPDIVRSLSFSGLRLLSLSEHINENDTRSFKKKAISIGITEAKGMVMVSTDADCLVERNWLNLLAAYYEKHQPKFMAAPVNFHREESIFERFQSLDFLGMMGVTGAGLHRGFMSMCNGANLAYEKKAFEAIGGFSGIDHLASGDDMLLMQKMAEHYPGQLAYVKNKEARTYTTAQKTLRSFIRQRIRWASKSSSYQEVQVTFILAMVFFFCCNIVLCALLIPFFGTTMLMLFLFQLLVKGIMDYFFLSSMSQFFDRTDLMRSFIPAFFMHILYIVGIGFLANIVKQYEWKGRRVK